MALSIYNTLTRRLEPFIPLESGHVRMYVCGMTVYDLCHLGHARSMVAFDVVQRWLKASGYRVTYVRNITDIDDKIIARAVKNGEPIAALTQRMIDALHEDADALGIERPSHEPRATDFVPQMLALIGRLEARGLAYRSEDGDVNYAVRRFDGYGRLSGKSLDELRAGERVAVTGGKQDPLDFVLWKAAKPDEPADAVWAGAYGLGRPGWHIECSAMSCEMLGETFDIHGGGADLQFPHHENEIAQSEGATGQPLARYWMHNGFVRVDNEKMSKSLGNFFTIREVLSKFDPETVRFFILRAHYRSSLNYSDVHLADARAALKRLYTALAGAQSSLGVPGSWTRPLTLSQLDPHEPAVARFVAAMDDDFNTPEALGVLFGLAAEVNLLLQGLSTAEAPDVARAVLRGKVSTMLGLAGSLGLLQQDPVAYLQGGGAEAGLDEAFIESQIEARAEAKRRRDFAEADRIRTLLASQGVMLKDGPGGTTWERA